MITVETEINATIQKVWEYWTNPEYITQWNFASSDWHCPSAINNIEPGATFTWRMEAKDGSAGFDFCGRYTQIERESFISYLLEDGRKVQIEFKTAGNKVYLKESFEAEGTNADEMQRTGWQSILENFKKLVEASS